MSPEATPRDAAKERPATLPLLRRLIHEFVRPYVGRLAVAFVCMGIMAGATAANAWLMQPMLDALMRDRTTVVIAHRLSTVTGADLIYVIDKSRVVEQGTHVELMRERGVYARLYALQFADQAADEPSLHAVRAS